MTEEESHTGDDTSDEGSDPFDDRGWHEPPSHDADASQGNVFRGVRSPRRRNFTRRLNHAHGLTTEQLNHIGAGNPVHGVQRVCNAAIRNTLRQEEKETMNRERKEQPFYGVREFGRHIRNRGVVGATPVDWRALSGDAWELLKHRSFTRVFRERRVEAAMGTSTPEMKEAASRQVLQHEEYSFDKLENYLIDNALFDTEVPLGSTDPDRPENIHNYLELAQALLNEPECNRENPDYLALLRLLSKNKSAREELLSRYNSYAKPESGVAKEKENQLKYGGWVTAITEWQDFYTKMRASSREAQILRFENKRLDDLINTKATGKTPEAEKERARAIAQLGKNMEHLGKAEKESTEAESQMRIRQGRLPKKKNKKDENVVTILQNILNKVNSIKSKDPNNDANLIHKEDNSISTQLRNLEDLKGTFEKARDKATANIQQRGQNPETYSSTEAIPKHTAHQLLYLTMRDYMAKKEKVRDSYTIKLAVNMARVDAGTKMYADTNKKLWDRFVKEGDENAAWYQRFHPTKAGRPFKHLKDVAMGLSFKDVMKRLSYLQEFSALEEIARNPRRKPFSLDDIRGLSIDKDLLLELTRMLQEILSGYQHGKGKTKIEIRPQDALYLQNLIEMIQKVWAERDALGFTHAWNKRSRLKQATDVGTTKESFILGLLEEQRDHRHKREDELMEQFPERGIEWKDLLRRKKIYTYYKTRREEWKDLSKEEREEQFAASGMRNVTMGIRMGAATTAGLSLAKNFLKEKSLSATKATGKGIFVKAPSGAYHKTADVWTTLKEKRTDRKNRKKTRKTEKREAKARKKQAKKPKEGSFLRVIPGMKTLIRAGEPGLGTRSPRKAA